mmetsp:Transcript_44261/g.104867  ORF Transcript_44261/g.104867 Transcript_44261/m.104867 type:complete len:742 (+) Transcript_44261:273-2498(+)
MTSRFNALPWPVLLEKLWELDRVSKVQDEEERTVGGSVLKQCQRAFLVASVCREWRSIIKGALNGCQSALHLIARNEFGTFLADGWGIPRARILDSLQKSIFIETDLTRAEGRPPIAKEAVEVPWAINLLSTCGSQIVMAVASDSNGAVMFDAWLGRDSPEIRYGLATLCLHQSALTAYLPCSARVNALHLSVSGLLFTADQKGRLRILASEADAHAPQEDDEQLSQAGRRGWVVAEEWASEGEEAIQAMCVREETPSMCEYQIALVCCSAVYVLQRKDGHLLLRSRIPIQGGGWQVQRQPPLLSDISAQILFAGPHTLRFCDGTSFGTWDLTHPPSGSDRERVPRANVAGAGGTMMGMGGPFNAAWMGVAPGAMTETCRLVPAGLLVFNQTCVVLKSADGERVVWKRSYSGVLDAWGDESVLILLRQNEVSVVSMRNPEPVVYGMPRSRALGHAFAASDYPVDADVQRLWSLRACSSGAAIAFVELSLTRAHVHLWFGTGAKGWKAVERAHYKSALQATSLNFAPYQFAYLREAALDYLCVCIASELDPEHLPHLHPPADSASPSPSSPPSLSAHTSIASLQIEVLRSRRSCGAEEGDKIFEMLVTRCGGHRRLGRPHEDGEFWRERFVLEAEKAEELAAAARECVATGRLLLQLPQLHPLLLRHLRLSFHPPRLSSLFSALVANTYPDPVEIDAIGRGQGKLAAVKEWMRRWRSDIRMLVGEKDALTQELDRVLAMYHT